MFRLRPPNWDEAISPELSFGETADSRFLTLVEASTSYLEFGAGSSTLQACRREVRFTTVESDSAFLAAVERKCDSVRGKFLYADIGPTGPWGVPRERKPTLERSQRWQRYPLAPWRALGSDFLADVILVDGRFRVACVLAVVLNQSEADWTVLFDDYGDRPEYSEVEEFATLVARHGRMAEFIRRSNVDLSRAAAAFQRFCGDWR
jgi:hypothetical protein